MSALLSIAVAAVLLSASTCLQWSSSPQNGQIVYACVGNDVLLPWSFNVTDGEGISSIEWFFDGRSNEMIAVYTHNNFLQMPSFSQRVLFVPNAGLKLLSVTKGDVGNFTVELNGYDSAGVTFTIRRTTVLQVADDLQTTDGHLHVTQNPTAVLDPKTDQWRIELRCGTFTYLTEPPFDVEWLSPSGTVHSSTSYDDNQFRILLPDPVTTGNYTCRITHQSAPTACVFGNGDNKLESSLLVNGMEARLTLLEAHQKALQNENQELKAENNRLNTTLTQQIHITSLQRETQELRDTNISRLAQRVFDIEGRNRQQIIFYAHHLTTTSFTSGDRLIMKTVDTNQGGAYDNTTGIFTTPMDGFYFFIASSGTSGADNSIWFYLSVDGARGPSYGAVVSSRGHGETASAHMALHLTKGQKVWVGVSSSASFVYSDGSTFSGFLIAHDP